MYLKNIHIKSLSIYITLIAIISIAFPQNVYQWALELHARDVDSLGIGDYIRLEMEDHEPFEDCGLDRLCDINEPGYDQINDPDPSGDNYDPESNSSGTENNGLWDGDVFQDENGNYIYDEGEFFIDRNENGDYDVGEIYTNIDGNWQFEEGGTDGWRQGEDEYDIPAPFDDHTNIKFRHLEWLGAVDINGYECCPDGIFFSVDKRSWHTPDEIVKWDIYGNTQGIDGDIRLSWNVDSLNMDGIDYNIFMHIEGLPPLDMILNSTKIIPPGTLSSSLPNVSIVIGQCAEFGTVTYFYDNDEDELGSCESAPESEVCPQEFCSGAEPGECIIILDDNFPNCDTWEDFSYDTDPSLHQCNYSELISEEECVELGGISCEDMEPGGLYCTNWTAKWVTNDIDINDEKYCTSNYIDDCGVCDGYDENKDCQDVCFGTADIDACGICSGGTTGLLPNIEFGDFNGDGIIDIVGDDADCHGECKSYTPAWEGGISGDAIIDDCSICVGGNTGLIENDIDDCLICPENGGNYWIDDSIPGGTAFDCEGDYYYDTFICVDENYIWEMGPACDGVCFDGVGNYSDAFYDDCNTCSEGITGHSPNSDLDCLEQIFTPGVTNLAALSTETTVELTWAFESLIESAIAGFNIYYQQEGLEEWIFIDTTENQYYSVESVNDGTFCVSAFDNYNHESELSVPITATAYETYSYELHDGNNLISFRGLPENNGIENMFESLEEYITGVIGEGVAASHLGNGNWVGSLSNILPTKGYWVILGNADQDTYVPYTITQAYPTDQNTIFSIHDGANLISFIGDNNTGISEAIPDEVEVYFVGIIGEGIAASQVSSQNWVGSMQYWNIQKGYWLKIHIEPDDEIIEFQWQLPSPVQFIPGKNNQ